MKENISFLTPLTLGYICFIGAVFFLAKLFLHLLAKDEQKKQTLNLKNKVLISIK
jgi:hypothetical protein